jgi:hypothetical protein
MTDQPSDIYEEITRLVREQGLDGLLAQSIREVLSSLPPFLEQLTRITLTQPFSRDIALRCIAKRCHDGLSAIDILVGAGQAYASIGLLRPMCEDFLFSRFLMSIDANEASRYLNGRVLFELSSGIEAQAKGFSTPPMNASPLSI